MTEVKKGDTVRIVLEGQVSYVDPYEPTFFDVKGVDGYGMTVYPYYEAAKSVEIIAPPKPSLPKVGQIYSNQEVDDTDLPVGTLFGYIGYPDLNPNKEIYELWERTSDGISRRWSHIGGRDRNNELNHFNFTDKFWKIVAYPSGDPK